MNDTLKKSYTAGLGIIAITYEKAEKLTKDLIQKGTLAKEKQKEFINTTVEKAKQNVNKTEEVIKNRIDELSERGKPLKDKQDKLIEDLSKKTKKLSAETEKQVKKTVNDVMEKSKSTKEKIISSMSVEDKVEAVLSKNNVPTQEDIDEINKKLDELIKLQKKSQKKSRKTKTEKNN
jgi:polyhydroxyalkanoate synthesis regulator phasin